MNLRTIIFIAVLCFIMGLVIGASKKVKPLPVSPVTITQLVHDTTVIVKRDTIKIQVNKIKYYTRVDTVRVRDSAVPQQRNCVTFPLLLSDSSVIAVSQCSKSSLPDDLEFEAEYLEKRERVRIVDNIRVDTVRIAPKRFGFTLGPSAGVGIDINNISKPAYFIGATLSYGWRF